MTKPIATMPIDLLARLGDQEPIKIATLNLPLDFEATDKGILLKPVNVEKALREAFRDVAVTASEEEGQ